MASDVNVHAPAYPPSLLLGMWDNVSSPRPTPGALALTVVDTISRLQQSTQQQSTWELVLFYILLFPIIYLDNISSSSFIPVTHLMSDGPSSFLPPLEFTASAHAIDPLSVRNAKSGIGPDPIRIRAVLRREVCLNFGSVGCRLICLMFGKCVGVFDCICPRFYPAISSQRNATVGGTRVYALLV